MTATAAAATDDRRTPDEVLEQIVQILNLSNNPAATPEEAANAAAVAQRLMFRYNIAEARVRQRSDQVAGNNNTNPTAGFQNVQFDIGAKTSWINVWRRSLLHGIARANWCMALHYSGTSRMAIIGREENITAVKHMYEYLVAEIRRLCKIAFNELPAAGFYTQSEARTWQKSFCLGAVSIVNRRLMQIRYQDEREAQAAASDTSALVVIEGQALQAAFQEFHPVVRQGRSPRIANGDAYYAGREAGAGISLNRQIRG